MQGLRRPCRLTDWPRNKDGYGRRRHGPDNKKALAHRVAYVETYGPIPDGWCVLHHCDNPPCIEGEHLWLGTRADNNTDMVAKGRASRLGQRKLTPDQVEEIRSRYVAGGVTYTSLAADYGVSMSCISMAVRGHNWSGGLPRQNKPYMETAPEIRRLRAVGFTYREIHSILGVSGVTITKAIRNEI